MALYKLIVMYNPAADSSDQEFTSWLEDHVPEFLESPSAVAGTRFRLAQLRSGEQRSEQRYMTAYEIDTEGPIEAYHEMLKERSASSGRAPVAVFDRATISARFFELTSTSFGRRLSAPDGQRFLLVVFHDLDSLDEPHLPNLASFDEIMRVEQHRLAFVRMQPEAMPKHEAMTLYYIATDDLDALKQRIDDAQMLLGSYIDAPYARYFEQMGDRVLA